MLTKVDKVSGMLTVESEINNTITSRFEFLGKEANDGSSTKNITNGRFQINLVN